MGILVQPMTMTDLADVLGNHARFWGERDMRFLDLTALVQEFGETCLTARRGGRIDGYLIGFTMLRCLGYIHAAAVATRAGSAAWPAPCTGVRLRRRHAGRRLGPGDYQRDQRRLGGVPPAARVPGRAGSRTITARPADDGHDAAAALGLARPSRARPGATR